MFYPYVTHTKVGNWINKEKGRGQAFIVQLQDAEELCQTKIMSNAKNNEIGRYNP